MRATGSAVTQTLPGAAGPLARELMAPRWRGQPGRLEVWYTTITDPRSGTGLWLHHELLAPVGAAPALAYGWAAVFPPGSEPVFARFGPDAWQRPEAPAGDGAAAFASDGAPVFASDGARLSARSLSGSAGVKGERDGISWDLTAADGGWPLFTFPRWAWERELLPGAQIVPAPSAAFTGTVRYGATELALEEAPGVIAHLYGHGNARRWAWLHADLGGGDVAEIVAAVPARPGLRWLPALPFLRLRTGGSDWPASPLLAAAKLRARIGLPTWTVAGRVGSRHVRIEVTQPAEATVAVDYADPDGAPAVCHNTERAYAEITLSERRGGRWRTAGHWRLDGTAHAEVGTRPERDPRP